ncbi:hypothetical protein AMTRI_Chr08g167250 [Amborella trichopoda]
MDDFMKEKLMDAAMLLQQKLILLFFFEICYNMEMQLWYLQVVHNGSRHSCGTHAFTLGVTCIIDLRNGVGWWLWDGVCFLLFSVSHIQMWNLLSGT